MGAPFIVRQWILIGVCAYAALQHGLIAFRRPVARKHLMFALLCLAAGAHFLSRIGIHVAGTTAMPTGIRALEAYSSVVVFIALLWFTAAYTLFQPLWPLVALSVLLVAAYVLPVLLPFGVGASFVLMFIACVHRYRLGDKHSARTLGSGLVAFLALLILAWIPERSSVQFYPISEYGFLALILVMSYDLLFEIREGDRRVYSILDSLPAAVYIKDSDGRYFWVNRAFEKLFGKSRTRLAGRTDSDLQWESPSALPQPVRNENSQRVEPGIRDVSLNRGGQERRFSSVVMPVEPVNGDKPGVCGVLTDITRLHQAELETEDLRHQMWQAERVASIGAMTASIAHELNQPLSAILSNAQAGARLMTDPSFDASEIRTIFDDVIRDAKRASNVIGALRGMLRRNESEYVKLDLVETTREVLGLLHTELLISGTEVDSHFDDGCCVLGDKTLLQQVQLNLIMNAIEALQQVPRSRRKIYLSVTRDGEDCRFMIRDRGIGVDPEGLQNIFQMFGSTKPQGIGLGLAISRSIVESHDGVIWAERNLDAGMTFFFRLPAVTDRPMQRRFEG